MQINLLYNRADKFVKKEDEHITLEKYRTCALDKSYFTYNMFSVLFL